MLKILLAVAIAVSLSGCGDSLNQLFGGDTSPSKKTFPEPTENCASATIPGEYLVKWKSGEITKVYGPDADKFREGFVTEHIEEIEAVEHNRKLELEPYLEPEDMVAQSARWSPGFLGSSDNIDNWQIADVEAEALWAQGHRGQGVVVAVIDSEVDIEHDQLENQLAVNAGEIGPDGFGQDKSVNGIDDDGNGYVDDAYGYNFIYDSGNLSNPGSHGTHVAGIVAAEHADVDTGFRSYTQGIAPEAKILPLAFIDTESGSLDDAIEAMDYAKDRGVDIVNASWGARGSCSSFLKEKINELGAAGILFIAASGNEGLNVDQVKYSPAGFNLNSQITVGATGRVGVTTFFSNVGLQAVHLFAPGDEIISTVPCASASTCKNSGTYSNERGTSMAAPLVAGAAALLKSAVPSATAGQIKSALMNGSMFNDRFINASKGRLNVRQALEQLQ